MPELVRDLKGLSSKVERKGMRKAMTAGGKPILQATRALVPVRTGLLRQSLANKIVRMKNGTWAALTGARRLKATKKKPKRGFKIRKGVLKAAAKLGIDVSELSPTRYAHLVEFGHASGRGGAVRGLFRAIRRFFGGGSGKIAAKPFMRPGLRAGASASREAIRTTLKDFIETEAGK